MKFFLLNKIIYYFFSEYEPIDSSKNTRIQEELIPELDDAIVRTSQMRKNQPKKCRSFAKKTANNTLKYYVSI